MINKRKTLIFLLSCIGFLLLNPEELYPDWVQTNGPFSGNVTSLAVNNDTLFVGTYRSGFVSLINNGTGWIRAKSGLFSQSVSSIAISGNSIFAATDSGVFRSTNNGTNWTVIDTNKGISSLVVSGGKLFAVTRTGLLFTTNNGASWAHVDSSLPSKNVYSLKVSGSKMFAGTQSGIFLSNNNGESWTFVDSSISTYRIECLAESGGTLFAGTSNGVFRSSNNGESWTPVNSGITNSKVIRSIAVHDSAIFVGTFWGGGIFHSTNNGDSWFSVTPSLINPNIPSLLVSGNTIFAGTTEGVFVSTNNGTSWTPINLDLNDGVQDIVVSGKCIFAGMNSSGVFLSTNDGASWKPVNSGLTSYRIASLTVSDSSIFAGTDKGLFVYNNKGAYWTAIDTTKAIWSILVSNKTIVAGTYKSIINGYSISHYANDGKSWIPVNSDTTPFIIKSLSIIGSSIFAGTDKGVFLSTNNGTSWNPVSSGLTNKYVNSLSVIGNKIFAGTDNGTFLSTNNGESWTKAIHGIFSSPLVVTGSNIFSVNLTGQVFLSADGGTSWSKVDSVPVTNVKALAVCDSTIFVGTYNKGIWRIPVSDALPIKYKPMLSASRPEILKISSYKNSASLMVTIELSLSHQDNVELSICNLSGREVASLPNKIYSSGVHAITFPVKNAGKGFFIVKIKSGSKCFVKRFVNVH